MVESTYRIRIKDGTTELEIAGDKRFVQRSFKEIKALLNKHFRSNLIQVERKSRRKRKPGPKPKISPPKERTDMRKMSLQEIFKVKNPKRENQRVLLLAYYLNKVTGKREFKIKDLKPLYDELKLEVPKNLGYFLRSMSSEDKGLLVQGRKQGRFKITEKGIDFIYEKIPSS